MKSYRFTLSLLIAVFIVTGLALPAYADDNDDRNPVDGFFHGTGECISGFGEGTGKVLKGMADGTGNVLKGMGEGIAQTK